MTPCYALVGLLAAEPDSPGSMITSLIMVSISLVTFVLFIWLVVRALFGKGKVLQDKAIDQFESATLHMERVEKFMAMQEKQGLRIIELLESIDRNLKRPTG